MHNTYILPQHTQTQNKNQSVLHLTNNVLNLKGRFDMLWQYFGGILGDHCALLLWTTYFVSQDQVV